MRYVINKAADFYGTLLVSADSIISYLTVYIIGKAHAKLEMGREHNLIRSLSIR